MEQYLVIDPFWGVHVAREMVLFRQHHPKVQPAGFKQAHKLGRGENVQPD